MIVQGVDHGDNSLSWVFAFKGQEDELVNAVEFQGDFHADEQVKQFLDIFRFALIAELLEQAASILDFDVEHFGIVSR